jgi:hypothetical protein
VFCPDSDWQASIERLNPKLPYTVDNCVVICVEFNSACNRMKRDRGHDGNNEDSTSGSSSSDVDAESTSGVEIDTSPLHTSSFVAGQDCQWTPVKFDLWHTSLGGRHEHWDAIDARAKLAQPDSCVVDASP